MLSSSMEFTKCPLGALPDGRIQACRLLEVTKALSKTGVAPFRELIDQGQLNQRRLLGLKSVANTGAHLWLAGVAAESVERGQAHIHAGVIAQSVKERGKDFRIKLILAPAEADTLQPFAGGLLLKHGQNHQLTHVGKLGTHGSQVV